MKQTQSNERAPKRFNIVDVIILVLVVALVAGAVWKLTSASTSANENAAAQDAIQHFDESPHMRFTVVCTGVLKDAAEKIAASDDLQLFNGDQDLAAYITSCTVRDSQYDITGDDGMHFNFTNPDTCVVTFVAEGYFDRDTATKDKAYQLGSQQLRIGKNYIMKTKSFEVNGYITAMEVVNE